MARPAIFSHFPGLQSRVPWTALGDWPTPVARLDGLSRRLDADIWVKRDDLSSPRYGGNKVRKLEHLLADAVARGARRVLTVGGIGSNHVVATGLYAGQLNMTTRAVVVPQPVTRAVHRNLELARALGIELRPCAARPLVPLCMATARRSAGPCYVVGPGGSSPLGSLGYVSAGLELGQQIADGELPAPDAIYIALGSGGSMAGLAVGCALAGLTCPVVGVRVVERPLVNLTLVRLLVHRTTRLIRATAGVPALPRPRMQVVHGQLGRCYGDPTPSARRALDLVHETDGIVLETTYTAKALAALMEQCRGTRARVLFWNTYNSRDTSKIMGGADLPPLPPRIARWLARQQR